MKRYYSLREISQELDIPKSTIVKYKDYFGDYMKMAGDGKRKKFEEEAMSVLRDIREMREQEKLDWLEIKDILDERYGTAEEEVEPEAPADAAALLPQLEYISHVVNAIGGEFAGMTGKMNKLQDISIRQNRAIKIINKKLQNNRNSVDIVMAELLEREKTARKEYSDTVRLMKQGFAKILINMQHIRESIGGKGNQSDFSELEEKVDKLSGKVEQVLSEGTLFQGKYQVLLRENELLRRKLNEIAAADKTESEPQKPTGIIGMFKKTQPR